MKHILKTKLQFFLLIPLVILLCLSIPFEYYYEFKLFEIFGWKIFILNAALCLLVFFIIKPQESLLFKVLMSFLIFALCMMHIYLLSFFI